MFKHNEKMYLTLTLIIFCLLQWARDARCTERQLLRTSHTTLHNIKSIRSIEVHINGTIVYEFSDTDKKIWVDHEDIHDGYNRFARYHDELSI